MPTTREAGDLLNFRWYTVDPRLREQELEVGRMQAVQLALGHEAYANTLRNALRHEQAFRGWQVERVASLDLQQEGVIVVDMEVLDKLPSPLLHPERVVLVTKREPQQLRRAWDAGIVSVVSENEPLSTAMLAVLAARFRAPRG